MSVGTNGCDRCRRRNRQRWYTGARWLCASCWWALFGYAPPEDGIAA
jgi:ribosomal protein L37AE/L43A